MNKSEKTLIKKNYFFLLFLLVLFTKPSIIDALPLFSVINYIWDSLRVVFMLVIFIISIFVWRKIYLINVVLLLMQIIQIISTIKNNGDLRTIILQTCNLLSLSLLFSMYIDTYNSKVVLLGIRNIFFVYLVANFLSQIIFPNGLFESGKVLSQNWFLGNKNLFIMFYLPYLYATFKLHDNANLKQKIIDIVGIVLIIISTIIGTSATGIVSVFSMCFIFLIQKKTNITLDAKIILLFIISIFFWFVFFDGTEHLSFIVEKILNKDVTFTGRTYIWKDAILWIKTSPIIGVGVQNSNISEIHLFGYAHCHCTYLNFWLNGGVLTFLVFCVFLFLVAIKIKKYSYIEKSFFLAVLLIWLVDVYSRQELLISVFIYIYITNSKKYFLFFK